MKTYHLQVITPEEIIFDGQAQSLVVPGTAGYLGVLADHTPILTTKGGDMHPDRRPKKRFFYKNPGGFLEVSRNQASLLVDTITPTEPVNFMIGI